MRRAANGGGRERGLGQGLAPGRVLGLVLGPVRGLVPGVLVLLVLGAGPASAGAWPREAGHSFLSVSLRFDRPPPGARPGRPEQGFYLEHGLRRGWLLALDANRGGDGAQGLVVSLGHAVQRPSGTALGWALGIGVSRAPGSSDTSFLRPALAWGRGFGAGQGPFGWAGWVSVEGQVDLPLPLRQHRPATGLGPAPKLTLTLGLKPRPGWMVILAARAEAYPGGRPAVIFAPALVRGIGRGRQNLLMQPEIPMRGSGLPRLKLAFWTEF